MGKKCVGCGIELQNTDPQKEGYTPKEFEHEEGEVSCQRCFKVKNYGEYMPIFLNKDEYRKEVSSVLHKAKVAIAVFDIIDFEGSFDVEILDILRDMNSIVVINKLDLIPNDKHPSKVAEWAKRRLAEEDISPLDIAIVSSKNGYGINGIFKKLKHFYPDGVKALILGATNVGKSSIINRLLGKKVLTVSKYPGTTLKSVTNKIPMTNITLIDSPGLIPDGRFSDLVCEKCNLKIVPASNLNKKTFKLTKDRVILIEKLVSIRVLNEEEYKPTIDTYAAKDVVFHATNIDKAPEILKSDILSIPCSECIDTYNSNEMITKRVFVKYGEDLVFKGLGWLAVRRGPLELEVTYPKKAEIMIRKSLI